MMSDEQAVPPLGSAMVDAWREAEAKIFELEAKLAKAVRALDEAVYLLGPDEEDMMMKAGVYRVVTTLAALKGKGDEDE